MLKAQSTATPRKRKVDTVVNEEKHLVVQGDARGSTSASSGASIDDEKHVSMTVPTGGAKKTKTDLDVNVSVVSAAKVKESESDATDTKQNEDKTEDGRESSQILRTYTCKNVRHECFEQIDKLPTREHTSVPGVVDIIAQYHYVASEKVFDDMASQFIAPLQNLKGAQCLDLDDFDAVSSVWGNCLYACEDIQWLSIPPDVSERYTASSERVVAIKQARCVLEVERLATLSGQRSRREARWGPYEYVARYRRAKEERRLKKVAKQKVEDAVNDNCPASKSVPTRAEAIEHAETQILQIRRRRKEAEMRAESRRKAILAPNEDSGSDDDDDDISSYRECYITADDTEIAPYKLDAVLHLDEPRDGAKLGEFMSQIVTLYHGGYNLLCSLAAEQPCVRKQLQTSKLWDADTHTLKIDTPDQFLQTTLKLFTERYAHGDIVRFDTFRCRDMRAVWYRTDGTFEVRSATDDRTGSDHEMHRSLLPLLRVNPTHFARTELVEVCVQGTSYYLRDNIAGIGNVIVLVEDVELLQD